MIPERIEQLRDLMRERQIDYYMIPTSDFHESEYVGDYFMSRAYMTGFTGSAGTAVIGLEMAGLWTDGRYFIQAAGQLEGSGVILYKMGEEGVPTVTEFLQEHLPAGGCLAFDGRVVNTNLGRRLRKIADAKEAGLKTDEDLVGLIWQDRPALPCNPAFALEERYSGESTPSKLSRVREAMREAGAEVHIITSLDDINWLYNIRGNDSGHFHVVLSYAVITRQEAKLFVQDHVLTAETAEKLASDGVTVCGYDAIYEAVASIPSGTKVLLDCGKVNYRIFSLLREDVEVIDRVNPVVKMKAVKNPVELENLRKAHLKDGVAVTKFMYWLKKHVGKEKITEIGAMEYLADRRAEQEGFIDLSFDTISAYNENAAMMHYNPVTGNNAELKPQGFLLVDSGGHYYEGSTDITRTFALGELSDEMKLHFTTVCRSNLNLAAARFLYGCCGQNLDILSRGPLWDMALDYKCGTGHGVGYLLNIHEAPNGFRWKIVPERSDSAVFEEGMVTTDEPGVYLEGRYGIRTENELICRRGEKNEYGQFMYFEPLTYAPIDLDAIEPSYMTPRERGLLNDYHAMVYEKLAPYMSEEEREWLREYTRAV